MVSVRGMGGRIGAFLMNIYPGVMTASAFPAAVS